MSLIEKEFQKFACQFDQIEDLTRQALVKIGSEGGLIEEGVKVSSSVRGTTGVTLESTGEPICGIGSGKVVFFTERDFPPGNAHLNIYLHTDSSILEQAEALLRSIPRSRLEEIVTSYGYSRFSNHLMELTSYFPALINHPTAGYGHYSGNPEVDLRELRRNPTAGDLELLGVVVNSLKARLKRYLAAKEM